MHQLLKDILTKFCFDWESPFNGWSESVVRDCLTLTSSFFLNYVLTDGRPVDSETTFCLLDIWHASSVHKLDFFRTSFKMIHFAAPSLLNTPSPHTVQCTGAPIGTLVTRRGRYWSGDLRTCTAQPAHVPISRVRCRFHFKIHFSMLCSQTPFFSIENLVW